MDSSLATTAFGLAKACYVLSTTIYVNIKQWKEIDKTLADLYLDLSELGKMLDFFSNTVGQKDIAPAEHWAQVKSSFDDLAVMLKTLESNLDTINGSGTLNWKGPTAQELKRKLVIYSQSIELSVYFVA